MNPHGHAAQPRNRGEAGAAFGSSAGNAVLLMNRQPCGRYVVVDKETKDTALDCGLKTAVVKEFSSTQRRDRLTNGTRFLQRRDDEKKDWDK